MGERRTDNSGMARLRRLVYPGHPHLIVQSFPDGSAEEMTAEDAADYVSALRLAAADPDIGLHGYGIGSREARILCTPAEPEALARMMQTLGKRFVRRFNQRRATTGTPWRGRFGSTVVEDAQALICLRVAEMAEVGLPANSADRPAHLESSVFHHTGVHLDRSIHELPAYWALGNTPFAREAAYRDWLSQTVGANGMANALALARTGWVVGNADFAKEAGDATNRQPHPSFKGRKPKFPGRK